MAGAGWTTERRLRGSILGARVENHGQPAEQCGRQPRADHPVVDWVDRAFTGLSRPRLRGRAGQRDRHCLRAPPARRQAFSGRHRARPGQRRCAQTRGPLPRRGQSVGAPSSGRLALGGSAAYATGNRVGQRRPRVTARCDMVRMPRRCGGAASAVPDTTPPMHILGGLT